MRAKLLRLGCYGFLAGIFISSWFIDNPGFRKYPALALIVCCILLAAASVASPKKTLLATAFFFLGLWYLPSSLSVSRSIPPPSERTTLIGEITFVEKFLDKQRLTVAVSEPESLRRQKIYAYARRYPLYRYGQVIRLQCRLRRPEAFEGFAWDKYTAIRDIYFICDRSTISVIGQRQEVIGLVFALKDYYSDLFNRSFHEPEASLVRAMIVNERQELPKDLQAAFSTAGVSHIIAISGLNITLIIFMWLELLLLFGLNKKRASFAIIIFLLFYLLLLGLPAPAVRAGIMGALVLLAGNIGRQYSGWHVLLLTATVMVMLRPLILLYDPSFQLSFLALAGMTFSFSAWKGALTIIPEWFDMRSLLAVTLAAQLFTWPLILYYWKVFSLVSPVVNILIVPLLPLITILAFALPLAQSLPVIAEAVIWPLFFLLKWMRLIPEIASLVPYAALRVGNFGIPEFIASYAATFVGIYWWRQRYDKKRT